MTGSKRVKIKHVISGICLRVDSQTNTQTDTLITILRSPVGGGVPILVTPMDTRTHSAGALHVAWPDSSLIDARSAVSAAAARQYYVIDI